MTTPIPNLSLVLSMDEDVAMARFGGGPAGPAGLVELNLAGDTSWLFDKAHPARLLELGVRFDAEGPSTSALAAVEAALGPEAVTLFQAGQRGTLVLDADSAEVVSRLGRLGLLDAERQRSDQCVAGLWAAEWAALAATFDERLGLGRLARSEALEGLEALMGLEPEVARAQPWVARRVVEVGWGVHALTSDHRRGEELLSRLQEWEALLGQVLEADMGRLFDEVQSYFAQTVLVASGAPMLGGEGNAQHRHSYVLEPALVPPGLLRGDVGLMANYDPSTGILEVTCEVEARADPDQVGQLWARAIDHQGMVVALSPLQARGTLARASLVVGADLDLAQTHIEITAKPTHAPASAALRALRRAQRHADAALRAERLGHFETTAFEVAAAAWRSCAGAWVELENVADQAGALRLAARDLALAGLTRDAEDLVGRARQLGGQDMALPEPEQPFLAEAVEALTQA
ncbi:MAG TPA: hypothetical protein VK988_22220 [Acidimicrobiales bacterium]|nr:hypothetical protein [Acidimicrobiales bacterium]